MNVSDINALDTRDSDYPIDPMFLARWSPRAMSGDQVTADEIKTLIDAARWAPSCFNAQPWRFASAVSGQPEFDALFETLLEGNQAWARQSGALVAVISRTRYERNDKDAPTHSFDAGAAWMSLALQARTMGLVSHAMQGFNADAARKVLAVPAVYDLPALIAIGKPGDISVLTDDYQSRETPSERKPLSDILFHGDFKELT